MYIAIQLQSKMQSWGNDSKSKTFGLYRGTMLHPSISGIMGLLATCLGASNGSDDYNELIKSVQYDCAICEKIPSIMIDYNTIGGGFDKNDEFEKNMIPRKVDHSQPVGYGCAVITEREYLINANFILILKALDEYSDKLEKAIKNPKWVPSFGRACCIPSTRLFVEKHNDFGVIFEIAKKQLNSSKVYTYSTINHWNDDNISKVFDLPIYYKKYRNMDRISYTNYR